MKRHRCIVSDFSVHEFEQVEQDGATNSLPMEMGQHRDVGQMGIVRTGAAGARHPGKAPLIPGGDHMTGIDDEIAGLTCRAGIPTNTIRDQLVPFRCQPAGLHIDTGHSFSWYCQPTPTKCARSLKYPALGNTLFLAIPCAWQWPAAPVDQVYETNRKTPSFFRPSSAGSI